MNLASRRAVRLYVLLGAMYLAAPMITLIFPLPRRGVLPQLLEGLYGAIGIGLMAFPFVFMAKHRSNRFAYCILVLSGILYGIVLVVLVSWLVLGI